MSETTYWLVVAPGDCKPEDRTKDGSAAKFGPFLTSSDMSDFRASYPLPTGKAAIIRESGARSWSMHDFLCAECETEWEELVPVQDAGVVVCPACGSESVLNKPSAPVVMHTALADGMRRGEASELGFRKIKVERESYKVRPRDRGVYQDELRSLDAAIERKRGV
jgi:DNA-directed RNA polymerase subunit RPC12/RpoP